MVTHPRPRPLARIHGDGRGRPCLSVTETGALRGTQSLAGPPLHLPLAWL